MNEFVPHSTKQEELILSDAEETIAATGTQWGKSQAGALWMKRQIHTFNDPSDNFIIGAPTYKIMQQSMVPYFLHYMEGYGDYSKSDGVFKLKRAGTVYFRTETDPDSIVGIPNVKAGWLDEAGKLRLYFYQNYQARAASRGARTLLTTSPYSRNWLYKEKVKPFLEGKLQSDKVKLIRAASWENPYHSLHDPQKRAEMRAQMDPRMFDMIFGGEWGQMAGLVYDCWDDEENLVSAFEMPVGTKYVAGIDWGYYPDPFVLKVRAITPDGRHYGVSEFVKTRFTITDIAQVTKQKRETFGVSVFYCDPSQPGYIEELNRAGCTAIGADNDIRRGLDLHYELIKTRRYKEFRGACPFSVDERETYHYPEPEDLGPDDNSKEMLPVDQNNHCMDVDRYLTIMTYRSNLRTSPKVPTEQTGPRQETIEQRLRRLKRGSRTRHSETWS